MTETETSGPICPLCHNHHDGPAEYCRECLMDFRLMLESGKAEVVEVLTEWLSGALTTKDHRPEEIECPRCQNEFKI